MNFYLCSVAIYTDILLFLWQNCLTYKCSIPELDVFLRYQVWNGHYLELDLSLSLKVKIKGATGSPICYYLSVVSTKIGLNADTSWVPTFKYQRPWTWLLIKWKYKNTLVMNLSDFNGHSNSELIFFLTFSRSKIVSSDSIGKNIWNVLLERDRQT